MIGMVKKMNYRKLINDIKNNEIKKVYLIYGSETYLIDKGWENLRDATVTSFPELNYTILDGEQTKASEVAEACGTFPFGTEKRLIVVRDLKLLKSKGASDEESPAPSGELKSYIDVINTIPDSSCLLFLSYGGIGKGKKLINEIKKIGAVYEFGRIDREDLATWTRNALKKESKEITPRDLDYLINSTGYLDKNSSKTLYDMESIIKKLINYMGETKKVEPVHIEAVLPRNIEKDIFKLINACSEKNVDQSLRVYNDLLLEGESSMGILALLSKQIKNMIQVSELHTLKHNSKSISEELKIHEYTVKLCIKYSRTIKRQLLHSAFHRCVETELSIKSGRMEERLAMEMLLVSLFE
jgi:DNA polymerase-3 subunit delta